MATILTSPALLTIKFAINLNVKKKKKKRKEMVLG
jgi:hypothetical protein